MLGHYIFLGIFYAVLAVIGAAIAAAIIRAVRDCASPAVESICWKATFEDLPAAERICRHQFTGEFKQRTCDRGFDCRTCEQHAALIARHPVAADGLFYHRGHTWVRPEPDGTVTIGLDPLGENLAAGTDSAQLPAVGSRIQVNGAAWYMAKRGARVRILAPVDGEVVATGGPGEGWYLKVRPDGGKLDDRHLLRGAEVQPWLAREWERLLESLRPAGQIPTMADGGMPVPEVAAGLSASEWERICGGVFLLA